jgi:hypothetical protein
MNTRVYVKMAEGSLIQGYPDYETGSEAQGERKLEWLKAGRRVLRQLARELGMPDGSYDLRINAGGPAVSGEATLHGEWLYINLGQSGMGPDWGFMWRLCNGRKDYTGGVNQWSKWNTLLDIPQLAGIMRAEHGRNQRNPVASGAGTTFRKW